MSYFCSFVENNSLFVLMKRIDNLSKHLLFIILLYESLQFIRFIDKRTKVVIHFSRALYFAVNFAVQDIVILVYDYINILVLCIR